MPSAAMRAAMAASSSAPTSCHCAQRAWKRRASGSRARLQAVGDQAEPGLRQRLQPGQGQPADGMLAQPAREQAEPQRRPLRPAGPGPGAAPAAARRRSLPRPRAAWGGTRHRMIGQHGDAVDQCGDPAAGQRRIGRGQAGLLLADGVQRQRLVQQQGGIRAEIGDRRLQQIEHGGEPVGLPQHRRQPVAQVEVARPAGNGRAQAASASPLRSAPARAWPSAASTSGWSGASRAATRNSARASAGRPAAACSVAAASGQPAAKGSAAARG